MILFNENFNQIEIDENSKINGGAYGNIFKSSNNKCIKVLNPLGQENFDPKTFSQLNELCLPGFYQIDSLLYQTPKDAKSKINPKGYSYEYINEEEVDIITMPTIYTLDNIHKLFSSLLTLTELNIRTVDLEDQNVILNKKDITVIDIDLYINQHNISYKELFKRNIYDLEDLFVNLYTYSISKYHKHLDIKQLNNILYSLFMIYDYESLEGVEKKLTKYKYPIDYINKMKKYY